MAVHQLAHQNPKAIGTQAITAWDLLFIVNTGLKGMGGALAPANWFGFNLQLANGKQRKTLLLAFSESTGDSARSPPKWIDAVGVKSVHQTLARDYLGGVAHVETTACIIVIYILGVAGPYRIKVTGWEGHQGIRETNLFPIVAELNSIAKLIGNYPWLLIGILLRIVIGILINRHGIRFESTYITIVKNIVEVIGISVNIICILVL